MTSKRLLLAGCLVGLTFLVGLLSLTARIASGQAPPTLPRPDLSGVVRFPPQVPVEVREPPAPPQPPASGPDVNVSNNGSPQNETTAAIDPTDLTQNHIVAGANDYGAGDASCGFYSSSNAGSNWVRTLLDRAGYQVAGDPSVAIDIFGAIQFVCLHFNRGGNQENAIILHTLPKGEQSFVQRTVAFSADATGGGGVFHDKPYVAVGPSGVVYVSWTRFVNAADGSLESAHIVFAYSTATGFSTPVVVSDTPYNQGSVPVVGGDGQVYVAWLRYPTLAGDPFEIRIDKALISFDGSVGPFGTDEVAAAINPIPSPFTGQNFRTNSFPSLAAGGTNVYLAWAQRGAGVDQADIVFSRSLDGGATWSLPTRVNNDATTRDQFFPWMAADGQGTIHVIWYDKRDDAKNKKFHTYYTRSLDGGLTFPTNQRVSDRASNPSGTDQFGGQFIGDYNGIAAAGSTAYPVFMAYRPSGPAGRFADQEVYSDKLP